MRLRKTRNAENMTYLDASDALFLERNGGKLNFIIQNSFNILKHGNLVSTLDKV